jgi:hypothetical protein
MGRMRTGITASLLVAALAIGAVTFALAAPGPSAKQHPTAKGHITNLWPGAVTKMPVTVKNPYPKAIVVKAIRAKVGTGAGALGTCAGSVLKVKVWRGKGVIKPRRSKRFLLTVTMAASAPNSCQGTRFPLTYVVKAVPKS